MPFQRDDDELAFMGLNLCDALDTRSKLDIEQRQAAIDKARKHAHNVLDRGKRKPEPETVGTITPAAPEGEPV